MCLCQQCQESSTHISHFMTRDLRKKCLVSIAEKWSLILTPDTLNASRPAHVNIDQLSPLISWAISAAEKCVFL